MIAPVGTIGGADVVYYGSTAHIPRVNSTSMHATTFHGSLEGTAKEALDANRAATANIGVPSDGGYETTVTSATNKTTEQPTVELLNSALRTSPLFGIREVEVDTFEDLKHSVDRSRAYGGITKDDLTTKSARSKLRDPNNISNETFMGEILSDGTVSKDATNAIPPKFGRTISANNTSQRGTEAIGPSNPKAKVFQSGT